MGSQLTLTLTSSGYFCTGILVLLWRLEEKRRGLGINMVLLYFSCRDGMGEDFIAFLLLRSDLHLYYGRDVLF